MSDEYKRFTVSLPEELYEEFEAFRKKLDISRSEGIRKAMHAYMVSEENIQKISGDVVGCISMIMAHEHFDHTHLHTQEEESKVSNKETEHTDHDHEYSSKPVYANVHQTDLILSNDIQHHFSDIIISNLHIHLQFDRCLEIIALSGPYDRVTKLKSDLQRLKSVLSIDLFIIDKEK